MQSDKNLKPCPFCKGKPRRKGHVYSGKFLGMSPRNNLPMYEELHWYIVECTKCGIAQPKRKYNSREESDTAWNTREE